MYVPNQGVDIVFFRKGTAFYFMGIEVTVRALPDTPGQMNIKG